MISRRSTSVSPPPSAARARPAATQGRQRDGDRGLVNCVLLDHGRGPPACPIRPTRRRDERRRPGTRSSADRPRTAARCPRCRPGVRRASSRERAIASSRRRQPLRHARALLRAPARLLARQQRRAASRSTVRRRRPPARTRPPPRAAADRARRRRRCRRGRRRRRRCVPARAHGGQRDRRPAPTATAPASAPTANGRQSEIDSHANRSRRWRAPSIAGHSVGGGSGTSSAARVRRPARAARRAPRVHARAAGCVRPHRRRLRGRQLAVDERRQPFGRVRRCTRRRSSSAPAIRPPAPRR